MQVVVLLIVESGCRPSSDVIARWVRPVVITRAVS
jgi:hypothetical protein